MSDIAGEEFDDIMDLLTTLTVRVDRLEVKLKFIERAVSNEIDDMRIDDDEEEG